VSRKEERKRTDKFKNANNKASTYGLRHITQNSLWLPFKETHPTRNPIKILYDTRAANEPRHLLRPLSHVYSFLVLSPKLISAEYKISDQ